MKETSTMIEKITKEWSMLPENRSASAIKKMISFLWKLHYFFKEDLNSKTHLSVKHTLRAWRHGILRFRYKLYGLDKSGDPGQYFSDLACFLTMPRINGLFGELLNNKYTFGLLMRSMGMPTPEIKGLILKGAFYPHGATQPLKASEFLRAAIPPGKKLVLKPNWGYHGFGFICLSREDAGYRLNNENIPLSHIVGMIDRLDNCIVTEFVQQGQFSKDFFPHTANTVRMVTIWDAEKSEAFLARAVLRIGTSRSFPVDNFKAGLGGLSVLVDPDTGELGPGASTDSQGNLVWYPHHPESHAPIQGSVIPAWGDIRAKILDYAGRFASMPFIGWDIILTDDGISILEGNSTPGLPVLQVHGSFFADPRVRRFFRDYKGPNSPGP